jgi:IS30 family transposase
MTSLRHVLRRSQRIKSRQPLSSDAKCNTPRRFDIGKVVQDLKECCHALHAAGAYQLRRRREAILEREAALRRFVGDRLAEGWTPEQISGWLKCGNEPRLQAIGCETIYAFIYRTGQKAQALWRYLTRRHKRRCPRHARASRDAIKDRASNP